MKNSITTIIVTRNRPLQLRECLRSVLKSTFNNYQILVVDQNSDEKTTSVINSFHSEKIKVVKMRTRGKSKGLNLAYKRAKSEILAFTDDDCVVTKSWLGEIYKTYNSNPQIAGVFGNTYPYHQKKHPNEICSATFRMTKFRLHVFQNLHYYNVGLGNNMSIRKSVLEKVGGFQEWLGPGAVGKNGEESEIIFRILKSKYTLATNPRMTLFHNRWLTYKQERILQTQYTSGFIAFLSYYLFTSNGRHAWSFIKVKIEERTLPAFYRCRRLTKQLFKEYYLLSLEVIAVFRGIFIGLAVALGRKLTFLFDRHSKVE